MKTSRHAHAQTICRPVDDREEGEPDTKETGEVEVVDSDWSGSDHHVHNTGDGVDTVEKHIQHLHPGSLHDVELNNIGVESSPVDKSDPESNRW